MTVKEILDASKEKMSKSVAVYQNEMTSLRAGRANPRLLDRIMVDYYGTPTPLPQIGNINVPEARMIVIKPWEKKMISAIEKAIQKSDLGLNPTNDGEVVRLVFPDLNEERRKELTKMARKSAEGAKVAVRSIRRDAVEQIKKLKRIPSSPRTSSARQRTMPRRLPTRRSRTLTAFARRRKRKSWRSNPSMVNMPNVLGMRLEDALAECRAQGVEPAIVMTLPPKGREQGTIRVIRAKEGVLTVSRFEDELSPVVQ